MVQQVRYQVAEKHNPQVEKVYSASSVTESQQAYDDWSNSYEADIFKFESRFPFIPAAVFTRFVKPGDGVILDAGCGTGLHIEPIYLAGYRPIVGIDLSEGMLSIAKEKNIYSELHRMTLGNRLDFEDNRFANTITVGTITPGHAPAHSYEELIRVTKTGGLIVVNLRSDDEVDPDYPAALKKYEDEARWQLIFESAQYPAMPAGEPDVLTTVYVYKVLT